MLSITQQHMTSSFLKHFVLWLVEYCKLLFYLLLLDLPPSRSSVLLEDLPWLPYLPQPAPTFYSFILLYFCSQNLSPLDIIFSYLLTVFITPTVHLFLPPSEGPQGWDIVCLFPPVFSVPTTVPGTKVVLNKYADWMARSVKLGFKFWSF